MKLRPPNGILALAIGVYGAMFFLALRTPSNLVKTDSQTYLLLAENLRTHHVFSTATTASWTRMCTGFPGILST
jgi:hypothetical protein